MSVDLRSERPAPDRTAQQSYREELQRQVCEKKVRREREKKEIEAYELKADLKVKQVLAGETATAAGPGPAGTADKGKENSAVQQDQHQLLAHSSKALSTTEQPVQEGTHDPATHLDRQPNQGRHDRNPQPARANDPPHLDRQLEAERPRHISSSADHISTSADPELRRQLEHERQRVRQLTDECEALRQREAQQQQLLRAVQERQVEWERRSAQDELEWRRQAEQRMQAAVAEMRRDAAVQQQRLQGMLQQLATHASTHASTHVSTHATPYAPYVPAAPLAVPPWPQGTPLPLHRASVADRPAAVTAAGGASAYAYGAYGSRPQSAGLSLQPRPGSAVLGPHSRPGSADLHSWVSAAPPLPPLPPQLPPPAPPSNVASGTGRHATIPSEVGHATVPSEELQKLLEDFLKHGIAPRDGNPPPDGISPRISSSRGEQRTFMT